MSKEVTVSLVLVNGLIDENLSLEAFVKALQEEKELERADYETIPAALDQFKASNPGLKSITFDTLVSMTTSVLNPSAAIYDKVKDRVRNFVRNHPDQFYIGKRDGVRFMDRASAEELLQIAANRAAAAKREAEKAAAKAAQ